MGSCPQRRQTYWGYNLFFPTVEYAKRFAKLYDDVLLDCAIKDVKSLRSVDNIITQFTGCEFNAAVHIVVEKGTIGMIKKAFGKKIITKNKRYYILS